MNIDFKLLKEQAKVQKVPAFFAIVLGPSGAGKSTLMGTLNVPTLFLHTRLEGHGATSAKGVAKGDTITDKDMSLYKKDGTVDCDATYKNLLAHLRAPDIADHFEAVVIDSATELEQTIRKSQMFVDKCKALSGKHNTYSETPTLTDTFKEILETLKMLHDKEVHCFFTCAATQKPQTDENEVMDVTPTLQGYGIASEFVKNFQDVLLVSRLSKEDEAGNVKSAHALVFKSNISKTSKDLKGVVVKSMNFSPRCFGLPLEMLPDVMKADLSLLIKKRNEYYAAKVK